MVWVSTSRRYPLLAAKAWRLLVAAELALFPLIMQQADPDLWGHVKFGLDHLSLGALQHVDPYSYTASGKPWVNHEWLFEIVLAAAYRAGDSAGLLALKAAATFSTGLLLWKLTRRGSKDILARSVVFTLSFLVLSRFSLVRPQLASFFLFSLLLYLCFAPSVQGGPRQPPRKLWIASPLIMGLWSNLHGGFVAGLCLLFLVGAARAARREWAPLASLALILLCAGATLANPYGTGLHATVFRALGNPLTRATIVEWKPPAIFDPAEPILPIFFLFLVAVYAFSRSSRQWEDALVFGAALLTLTSFRHFPFLAIVAALCLPAHATSALGRLPCRAPFAAWFFILASLFCLVLFPTRLSIFYDTSVFPREAVRWIKRYHRGGNVCGPFGWGEYLIFHLYPSFKVCMDGRYDTVYPIPLIAENFDLFGDLRLKRHPMLEAADVILLPPGKPLARRLETRPDFHLSYADAFALVFTRQPGEPIRPTHPAARSPFP